MGTTGEHVNRNRTIINLAYEGVPQRAIARALQLPANEVGEVVADAVTRGIIVGPSESEWPQGSRAPRHPAFARPPIDEGTLLAAAQSLALTKTQAALFLALVRRKFCTSEILHGIIESRRRTHLTPTNHKIVGVMIYDIRKRLKGRYIIQTVQGSGYFIADGDRRRAAAHLLGCIGLRADNAGVKKLTGNLELPAPNYPPKLGAGGRPRSGGASHARPARVVDHGLKHAGRNRARRRQGDHVLRIQE
jgi:hypothetical protein